MIVRNIKIPCDKFFHVVKYRILLNTMVVFHRNIANRFAIQLKEGKLLWISGGMYIYDVRITDIIAFYIMRFSYQQGPIHVMIGFLFYHGFYLVHSFTMSNI